MAVKSYRELHAWQRAMTLVREVYKVTDRFPERERFGLTNQLRRSAVSVPSNIAEGQGRGPGRDFDRFLNIAHGSLCEAETQILIAEDLKYLSPDARDALLELAAETGRLIRGLQRSLSKN